MKNLRGKTAVITGAGSGIGRSIALALAEAGTNIVVSDIREESAQRVRDEVKQRGVEAIAVKTDVASRDSVVALADEAYRAFGQVDILCNNAGVTWRPMRSVLQATMADWTWIMGVNLWGVIHGVDVFVPRMSRQDGEKHIVNTSSILGLRPEGGHVPYSASKAAITALSEGMAQELAPLGFGVTILHPSGVSTNLTTSEELRPQAERSADRQVESYDNARLNEILGDMLDPEAVGRMVRHAIEHGQLYLLTHPLPKNFIEERVALLHAAAPFGKP